MQESDGQHDHDEIRAEASALDRGDACPTQHQLELFILGKLEEPELSIVGEHSDHCLHCQSLLTTLDEKQDKLLARLRRRTEVDAVETTSATTSIEHPLERPNDNSSKLAKNENTEKIDKLLAKMEHRLAATEHRDWMQWARQTFGTSGLDEATRVGGCVLEHVLGVGGMGIVFAAHDEQLQRSVAIKVMRPERLADTAARQRFLREARAIAAIQHEHIVPVFQVGEEQRVPYFVMPLLRGRSLESRLHDIKRCELSELLQISIQIADGIAGAHAHGLIHRDIKPSNVWVEECEGAEPSRSESQRTGRDGIATYEGSERASPRPSPLTSHLSVKLLDFGLARAQLDDEHEPLSEDGIILGTPAYMSPEQAAGGDVDQRSDLFSLGCVMFRMATGMLPFPGRTVTQQLTALIKDSARPLRELNDELPDKLDALVQELLQRDPNQRPNSAAEVRDRLQALLDEFETDGSASGLSLKRRRKQPAVSRIREVLTVCGVMLVVGIFSWLLVNSRPSAEAPQPVSQTAMIEQAEDGSRQSRNLRSRESVAEWLAQLNVEPEWYDRVSQLPAVVRTEEVKAELLRRNPGIGDAVLFEFLGDRVRMLTIDTTALLDIAPIIVLRELQTLRILNSKTIALLELSDLRPLRDLPLTEVLFEKCPRLKHFESLTGKDLTRVSFYASALPDAEWFAQQKSIEALNLGGRSTPIDLTMLKHLPLIGLELNESPVDDLSPVAHHRLETLRIAGTKVSDLSPVVEMPLVTFNLQKTEITDLKPLTKLPHLTYMTLDLKTPEHIELVTSLKSLRTCNHLPMSQIDKSLIPDTRDSQSAKPVAVVEPIEPWLQRVAELPTPQLLEEVRVELCRRNSGLEEQLQFKVDQDKIREVSFGGGPVTDIGPLAALKDLQRLRISYRDPRLPPRELKDLRPLMRLMQLNFVELEFCSELRDLSPLLDKPLLELSLYATPLPDLNWLAGSSIRFLNLGGRDSVPDLDVLKRMQLERLELNETPISDLAPLSDMPLRSLGIGSTNVTDLTPLQRMPLVILSVQSDRALDLSPLTSIRTLKVLNCTIHDRDELSLIQSLTSLEFLNKQRLKPAAMTVGPVVSPATVPTDSAPSHEAAERLAQKVHKEMLARNPGYDAVLDFQVEGGCIVRWTIDSRVLEDISPLAQLPHLETIGIACQSQKPRNLSDISALRGMKLKQVRLLRLPKLTDFSALVGMPIETLELYGTPLPDRQWLSTLKLKELYIGGRKEDVDLSFVKEMPLTKLRLQDSAITDLRPLSGSSVQELGMSKTKVRDLSPLADTPLKMLSCESCPLDDLNQLLALKELEGVVFTTRPDFDIQKLRALPKLKEINRKPVSEVLK